MTAVLDLRSLLVSSLMGLVVIAVPAEARAHRLDVVLKIEAGELVLEVLFGDGTPVKKARAEVTAKPGSSDESSVDIEGETDDRGRWTFRPPQHCALHIVVSDPSGHRREVDIPPADLQPLFTTRQAPAIGTDGPSTVTILDTRMERAIDRYPMWLKAAIGVVLILLLAGLVSKLGNRGRGEK